MSNRNHDQDHSLELFAEQLADGQPVNWTKAQNSLPPQTVEMLRLINSVDEAHRSLVDDRVPFKTWGHLRLIEFHSQGSFGEVYRAHDPKLDRTVALKLVPQGEDFANAGFDFIDEARSLAKVRHDHVVTVHGVDEHEGRFGLWMEWLEGETLDALLDRQGPFTVPEAIAFGIDLCRAVQAVHDVGLIHRDVKLSNIVRTSDNKIILMDFGSASRAPEHIGDPFDQLTGTPAYLAPECFDGMDSGRSIDIYALGVVLYRLVSGEFPVKPGDAESMHHAHRNRLAVPLKERVDKVPEAFCNVVQRALDPDPNKRFKTASEFELALTQLNEKPLETKPAWPRFLLASISMVLVLFALLFAITQFYLQPSLKADVTFHRDRAGVVETLTAGTAVTTGDQLFLKVESDQSLHFYVVNQDEAGEQYVLFPRPELDLTNPIPPGNEVQLPGTINGIEQRWDVTSSGGQETILVVAAQTPLGQVEQFIARLNQSNSNDESMDLLGQLRGIGGLSAATPSDSPTDLNSIRSSLNQADKGMVKVWELTFENPH